MSVLIKGMKMPSSCMECPLSDHEAWCLIPGDWRERYYCPDDERSHDCPLVEIPEGARLIDADILYDRIIQRFDVCDDFLEMLEETPTIFEEGDEWK